MLYSGVNRERLKSFDGHKIRLKVFSDLFFGKIFTVLNNLQPNLVGYPSDYKKAMERDHIKYYEEKIKKGEAVFPHEYWFYKHYIDGKGITDNEVLSNLYLQEMHVAISEILIDKIMEYKKEYNIRGKFSIDKLIDKILKIELFLKGKRIDFLPEFKQEILVDELKKYVKNLYYQDLYKDIVCTFFIAYWKGNELFKGWTLEDFYKNFPIFADVGFVYQEDEPLKQLPEAIRIAKEYRVE